MLRVAHACKAARTGIGGIQPDPMHVAQDNCCYLPCARDAASRGSCRAACRQVRGKEDRLAIRAAKHEVGWDFRRADDAEPGAIRRKHRCRPDLYSRHCLPHRLSCRQAPRPFPRRTCRQRSPAVPSGHRRNLQGVDVLPQRVLDTYRVFSSGEKAKPLGYSQSATSSMVPSGLTQ